MRHGAVSHSTAMMPYSFPKAEYCIGLLWPNDPAQLSRPALVAGSAAAPGFSSWPPLPVEAAFPFISDARGLAGTQFGAAAQFAGATASILHARPRLSSTVSGTNSIAASICMPGTCMCESLITRGRPGNRGGEYSSAPQCGSFQTIGGGGATDKRHPIVPRLRGLEKWEASAIRGLSPKATSCRHFVAADNVSAQRMFRPFRGGVSGGVPRFGNQLANNQPLSIGGWRAAPNCAGGWARASRPAGVSMMWGWSVWRVDCSRGGWVKT